MLNIKEGEPIAQIKSGKHKNDIIYLDRMLDDEKKGTNEIDLKKNKLQTILNPDNRQVCYVCGPSGAGKSHYTASLIESYNKLFPKRDVFLFSRTDAKNDPAYAKLKKISQVALDESLIEEPIDIEEDFEYGSLVVFDDCNTINDKKILDAVNLLMADILECGRKLGLWIIITSHLITTSDRKMSKIIMNEQQALTIYPSGGAHQIKYCLKNYYGFSTKQIARILALKSRWVTILKNFPQCIIYEHGCYLL